MSPLRRNRGPRGEVPGNLDPEPGSEEGGEDFLVPLEGQPSCSPYTGKGLNYFYLDRLSSDVYRVGAHRFPGRATDRCASLQIEAGTVGAAGHHRALNRPVGKLEAIVRTHVVDGKEPLAEMKNRQTFAASDDCDPSTFGEIGKRTNGDTTGSRRRG